MELDFRKLDATRLPDFSKGHDFEDFYILESDKFKTMTILNAKRKELIRSISDKYFKLELKNNILSFGLREKFSCQQCFNRFWFF